MIELMVTITIAAIMLAIGVPAFRSLIVSQTLRAAAASLQASLNQTRAEALKRNANVTLSPNFGGLWNSGWNIVDPGTNAILFTYAAVPSITITGPASVVYQGSGRITATTNGKFQFSTTEIAEVRCVEVDLSGIAIVTSGACS